MKIQICIVDDEALGRERIRFLLEGRTDVEIAGEAKNVAEAIETITKLNPDIVLLDIRMPGGSGFDVISGLRRRGSPVPGIIFVTAYEKYAVEAFEVEALDYLLKPIEKVRLNEALDRAIQRRKSRAGSEWSEKIHKLIESLDNKTPPLTRLEIHSMGRWDYVDLKDVIWFQADGNYIEVHTRDKTHLLRQTLLALEKELPPTEWARIHRSIIVRVACVKTVVPVGKNDHSVCLDTGEKLPLTRDFSALQEKLKYPSS